MPILLDCGYDETHEYPDDWIFGGADELDPRADMRWMPTTYTYLDAGLRDVHVTQAPICLHQAIDEFTKVEGWGNLKPVYLQIRKPGDKPHVLDLCYVAATDTVHPLAG